MTNARSGRVVRKDPPPILTAGWAAVSAEASLRYGVAEPFLGSPAPDNEKLTCTGCVSVLRATTATVPFVFRNAVRSRWWSPEPVPMRIAPGRTKRL